jgi:hypothetical protein
MPASVLSVNGKLRSLYDPVSAKGKRKRGYNPVAIGKPLIIRYLYFFVCHKTYERKNKLMISTFLKAKESKEAAAEAINYFNRETVFDKKHEFRLDAFGGEHYGHPLIYYTKSYLGESLFMTTKIMELDKIDDKVVKAMQKGIGMAAAIPVFAEFLPYAAGAHVGVSIFQKINNLFNQDDPIVRGHNLDLYFNLENGARLQSGRVVCVTGDMSERTLLRGNKYQLSDSNRLVEAKTGKEYTESPYFVIQVDAKTNRKLESFDYYLGAAGLLKETNRGGNAAEIVSTVVDLFKGYRDIRAIVEIEDLSVDAGNKHVQKLIKALYKSMSNETRKIYKDRIKEITSS